MVRSVRDWMVGVVLTGMDVIWMRGRRDRQRSRPAAPLHAAQQVRHGGYKTLLDEFQRRHGGGVIGAQGGAGLLVSQAVGVLGIAAWTTVTSAAVFLALKSVGLLRMPTAADEIGIDAYEHGASVWPDVLPVPVSKGGADAGGSAAAPATGD